YVAVLREHGLGVELLAGHRMAHVLDGHELPVIRGRGDAEVGGQTRAGDDERVVARRQEGGWESREQATAVVLDPRRLTVHRSPGADDAGAVRRADALMTQADAQDRDRRPEPPHHVGGDPGVARSTGSRRDDDVRRPESLDLLV